MQEHRINDAIRISFFMSNEPLQYLVCDRGHYTFYNDPSEMELRCPKCGSSDVTPTCAPQSRWVKYTLIAIIIALIVTKLISC